jgi:hypothetical protein
MADINIEITQELLRLIAEIDEFIHFRMEMVVYRGF